MVRQFADRSMTVAARKNELVAHSTRSGCYKRVLLPMKVLWTVILFAWPAVSQTTQGDLVGRITDSITGRGVNQVSVTVRNEATTTVFPARADSAGNYAVASLSPGEYRVTVTAANYQTQQARALVLPVAGRVEL